MQLQQVMQPGNLGTNSIVWDKQAGFGAHIDPQAASLDFDLVDLKIRALDFQPSEELIQNLCPGGRNISDVEPVPVFTNAGNPFLE